MTSWLRVWIWGFITRPFLGDYLGNKYYISTDDKSVLAFYVQLSVIWFYWFENKLDEMGEIVFKFKVINYFEIPLH